MQEAAHLIFRSPFVSIYDVCCPTAFEGTEYALEQGCLVFVRSGIFAARIGTRTLLIDSNYAVWGSRGDVLCTLPSSKSSCTLTVIRYFYAASGGGASNSVALCTPDAYLRHARLLHNARMSPSIEAINGAATDLFSEAARAHEERHVRSDHAGTISEIRELLNQSLAKRISLLELANRYSLSPFTISRWFHKETGLSLREYMQRLRLRRALTFMLDEKRSFTAIALELGFYDESHFSKAFHAEFGTSPALAFRASADTPSDRPSVEQLIPD